jgi:hypothetical protein
MFSLVSNRLLAGAAAAAMLLSAGAASADPHFDGQTPADGSTITATLNVITPANDAELYAPFAIEAEDLDAPVEYRQYVRGWYKLDGRNFPQRTGSDKTGPWIVKRTFTEDGTKGNGAYGYRDDTDAINYYHAPGSTTPDGDGSSYYGHDTPGIQTDAPTENEIEFQLEFKGQLINPTTGAVYEERGWTCVGHAIRTSTGWEIPP